MQCPCWLGLVHALAHVSQASMSQLLQCLQLLQQHPVHCYQQHLRGTFCDSPMPERGTSSWEISLAGPSTSPHTLDFCAAQGLPFSSFIITKPFRGATYCMQVSGGGRSISRCSCCRDLVSALADVVQPSMVAHSSTAPCAFLQSASSHYFLPWPNAIERHVQFGD